MKRFFQMLSGLAVLGSIQKRFLFLTCMAGVLLTGLGLVGIHVLSSDNAPADNMGLMLGSTGLALVVMALSAWLTVRPVVEGLARVQSAAQQLQNPSGNLPSLQQDLPAELADIARALDAHVLQQQATLAQVADSMARLQRGQWPQSPTAERQGSDIPQSGPEHMLATVHAGLNHVSAMVAEMHHFIERMFNDVHDTAKDGPSSLSMWRDDPLLGPVLQKMTHGHLNLLKIVHEMTLVVEQSAITLADLSWQANSTNQKMKALAMRGAEISDSSRSLSHNSSRVSADAASVAQLAQQSRENSEFGQMELSQTIESMRQMGSRTQTVSSSITGLQAGSKKIEHIVQLIRDIANKINLLSLNAAIEAARAGEHGRGFAVVSDEVRKLAEKTFEATQEIDASVSGIMGQTHQAVSSMNELVNDVQSNVAKIEQVGQRLSGILNSSSVLSEQMNGIVHTSSESADEVTKISDYLGEIQDELANFGLRIESQEQQTLDLTELSEGFYEKLIQLNLQTIHRRMFVLARQAADAVQEVFEKAIAQGSIHEEDLLSEDHPPIPNTHPQKFGSRFDDFTDRVLPAIQEKVLQSAPELIFAICTNKRGYVPTHNAKFAHPLTGRYEVDLVNSRSKRIFSDRTGSRCGSHTQTVLLQTYKRDTGEIMHDLSVPIRVNGQHWGGFRMGYKAH